MRRKAVNSIEYESILNETVITKMYAGDLSLITGLHEVHGRIVLVRSGDSFAVIADHTEKILGHPAEYRFPKRETFGVVTVCLMDTIDDEHA